MQKTKKFDCVEMKRDAQKKLRERMKHTPGETVPEKLRYIIEHSDSPIAEFWRKKNKK